MFESTGEEPPEEGVAAGAPGPESADAGSPQEAADDSSCEPNGVWDLHDWSNIPVLPASDEPPPGWETDRDWLDELEDPQWGPVFWLDEVQPSGRLMCELEELPADLVDTDEDAVEMVAHWARLESYCAMRKRQSAGELSRRTVMAEGLSTLKDLGVRTIEPNIAGDELAIRLGIGKRAARTLVRSGQAFRGVGIPTAEALAAGEVDAAKADLIIAGVEDLEPEAALDVQYQVLKKAAHLPSGRLRRELATARAAIDPAHFEERCRAAAAARRVDRPRVLPDGMASLFAVMPAVEATQLYRAVDAAARSAKNIGDLRTLDQLRADALALMGSTAVQTGWIGACQRPHLDDAPAREAFGITDPPRCDDQARTFCDGLDDGGGDAAAAACLTTTSVCGGADQASGQPPPLRAPPENGPPLNSPPLVKASPSENRSTSDGVDGGCGMRVGVIGGRSAHVRVTIPLTTAMGGESGPGADVEGADDPADLEGYGPIPASVARALAAGGPWARMVTDPVDRTVLEVSRDTYEPPPEMAALVRAREPECANPTCGVPSDSCDLHHKIPWPIGATTVTNFDPGCRRDHLLLTHGGWNYVTDLEGCRTWTTAAGIVYVEDRDGNLTRRKSKSKSPGAQGRSGEEGTSEAESESASESDPESDPESAPELDPPSEPEPESGLKPNHTADELRRRYEGPPPF